MNLFEENRAALLAKLNQDKTEYFNSPIIKSKTPVPKKLSKETLKSKKQVMKKLQGRNERTMAKSSTNTCGSYFKRAKTKGSVSVELFNSTKEVQRPHSVISKSFFNHLELAQKVKAIKKYSGQLNIEKIIKKSLLKAKSTKMTKEKDQKHSFIQNEIRKQELRFHNNQIRIQNSSKTRKKTRKRSKKSSEPSKNGKSDSIPGQPQDFLCKVQELYSKGRQKEDSNRLDQHLQRKDSKSSMDELSDIQVNDLSFLSDKQKENSFIRTEQLNHKSLAKESSSSDGQLSRSLDLSIRRNGVLQEEDQSSPVNANQRKPQCLTVERQTSVKIAKVPIQLSCYSYTLSLSPKPKPKANLQLNHQSSASIPAAKAALTSNSHKVFSCCTSLSSSYTTTNSLEADPGQGQSLADQVSEELSSSLSHLFLIDQLKLFELSGLSDISKLLPSDLFTSLTFNIEKKFSALASFIQPGIETRTAKFVAGLSKAQNAEFLGRTQRKKQGLHALFNELRASQGFKRKVPGKEEEASGSSGSSSSSDERSQGISHSRSVARLHEGFPGCSEASSQEIDFGYKEAPPEPAVPVLKIDLKPVELEVGGSRRPLSRESAFSFAEKVLNALDWAKVSDVLEVPLQKDPLEELDKIQDLQIGTFTQNEIWSFDMIVESDEVNRLEICERNSGCGDQETVKIEKIYQRLVLECINLLLQQFRPFGMKGKPLPWDLTVWMIRKKERSGLDVARKVLEEFRMLNACCIGKHEEIDVSDFRDENAILKYKERQLDKVIYNDVVVEEEKWLDYGFEEAQVKIDLADVILYELVTEVININE